MANAFKPREDWLRKAALKMRSRIEKASGAKLPRFRVSCGFMSKGRKAKAIGECWPAKASADGSVEIFISATQAASRNVAAILAHELIHGCLPGIGHGPKFRKAANAIGFASPVSQFRPTKELWAWIDPLIKTLGPYPHAAISTGAAEGGAKKQTTRMLKSTCRRCGASLLSGGKRTQQVRLNN